MIDKIKTETEKRMAKSVESLRHDLTRLRTGRASTSILENIKVSYYGAEMPLSQVASISVADARTLTIVPWEKPMVAAVEKAILASDLGLTPTTAGTTIRINLPVLTEERRKELAKHVSGEGENAKVAIRNVRRDAITQIKELEKDKSISEDDQSRGDDDIQKLTDRFVREVDVVVKHKEDELMTM
ncbi:MAG: ribosome recycling factor [Dokdonella sp.]